MTDAPRPNTKSQQYTDRFYFPFDRSIVHKNHLMFKIKKKVKTFLNTLLYKLENFYLFLDLKLTKKRDSFIVLTLKLKLES